MKISEIPTNTLAAELSNGRLEELRTAIFESLHGERKKISDIFHQCDLEQLRRGLKPPGVRRPIRSEDEQEADCLRYVKAHNERLLLVKTLSVKQHHAKQKAADVAVFDAAVEHALGITDAIFPRMAGDAARKPNAQFFTVAESAIRAVADRKARKPPVEKAHIAAALQSKLYLEQTKGSLPTQREVREYAIKVFSHWFAQYGMKAYEKTNKLWKGIFKKAGLDYLPAGVRGRKPPPAPIPYVPKRGG